jgi:hypothetical protein
MARSKEELREYGRQYYYRNKELHNKHNREYNQANKEWLDVYKKKWRLSQSGRVSQYISRQKYKCRKYGITFDQLNQMKIDQKGMCAICSKPFTDSKKVHFDHDHITGKVRQLLCNNCNCGIGYFKDNIEMLLNAVEYLNKWNKRCSLNFV